MAADENDNDQTRSFTVLAAGTTISHYKIINKIGAGGMGEVYKAEDTELKREVALKFLPAHLCRDEVYRARFLREARAAAKLRHPNIVIIYEVSEYQGRPFFAMECCEGRPLYEVIRTEKPSLDKIIDLAVQICEGLQEAHDNGIIHRDIKPSNIILDKKNRLKLLDFGLAAVRGTDQLTKAGSTMGTIGYMSPEQIQGEEAGPRSDLFSLGVVLYEMITGRKPFNGEYEAAVLNSVLNDHPEPLLRYKSGIPGELQRIVSKLLEKDPKLRYQSAAGVISDLRQLELAGVKPAGRPFWKSVLNKFLIGFLIGVTLYVVGEYLLSEGDGSGASKMLAVLPFENLGEPDDEYFADGITDEIISRLAMLHGLGVISRTSTLQYKGTLKNLRQIGKELEVDYILEGSIRWSKSGEESRVRINPQLIRVADDVHLWADRYDAVIDDIFTVQSSIAEKVIDALDITLLESERRALNEQPTDNTEAYDYYLRGHEYLDNHNVKDYMNAEAMFNRAIELEPDFVSAYSWLAITHLQLYSQYFDRTEQRLHSAKEALDRALDIGPDNYDALGAQAWYLYAGLGDFDRALSEFIELRNMLPNEHMLSLCIALIKRRKGQWEDAV
ncbi:MAG: protein kinase, partial [candidate division Zixibacteria bacterium]|nr:protein kinase [candidate division Zixibacteria bacterium]